ncbi:MAG: transketolase family protein [Candidatus Anstonellales archaeon]
MGIVKEMKLIEDVLNPKQSLPSRDGFGKALVELGEKNPNVWVLTADVNESARTHWFSEKFPKRFVQVGISEQNMAGVAAGIASCGKTVFISSYGVFNPGRNFDQVRVSICYNNTNVILHGSHTGLTVGPDGATHQALEDIAMVRVLPNMTVVAPADYEEARKATLALGERGGPAYIRTAREKLPVFTTPETPFEIGKANVYREGKDIAIFAIGPMVYESLVAAEKLGREGVDCAVIDCHTIKPIDKKTIVEWAKKTGLILTVEEHQINGGMGSAICEVISEEYPCKVIRHGVYNKFCESGSAKELLRKYELDADGIAKKIKEAIKMKK